MKGFYHIWAWRPSLGHVTQMPQTNYCSPYPRRLHKKFGFDRASGLEKKMFEIVYDDGWMPDHKYPISSPAFGSGELKTKHEPCYKKNCLLLCKNIGTDQLCGNLADQPLCFHLHR